MKRVYNKLVRDNIPNIISQQGQGPQISTLSEDDFKKYLHEKLKEEVEEYLTDESIGEICDIFEVMYAILELKNISLSEMEKARAAKAAKNGSFSKRILLESVENNAD